MISIRKLALMAIAATAVTSPALAQSQPFGPDGGTGNIVPFSVGRPSATVQLNKVAAHQVRRHSIAGRQSGLNAFGMVPGNAGGNFLDPTLDPALTGGASVGYNDLIRQQW
jgi:hypothetical protein